VPFSTLVRAWRIEQQWKQTVLARRTRSLQGSVSSVERGLRENAELETLARFAQAFEVSLLTFLWAIGQPRPPTLAFTRTFDQLLTRWATLAPPQQLLLLQNLQAALDSLPVEPALPTTLSPPLDDV